MYACSSLCASAFEYNFFEADYDFMLLSTTITITQHKCYNEGKGSNYQNDSMCIYIYTDTKFGLLLLRWVMHIA